MKNFAPINDDHAVTGVLFGILLDEFVEPPTLDAARRANPWADALPAVSNLAPVSINQGGQDFPMPTMQFAVVRPDGKPLWSVKFSGYDIVVECTVYSRWEEVWKTASGYLREAFDFVRKHQADANIVDFRLQVTDQFTCTSDTYDIRDLLLEGNEFVPHLAFDGRNVWNSAVGWYEADGDLRHSDTVAVQIQGREDAGVIRAPYLVTIQHFGKAAFGNGPSPESIRLDAVVRKLHDRNKTVMMKLLTPSTCDRIGLRA